MNKIKIILIGFGVVCAVYALRFYFTSYDQEISSKQPTPTIPTPVSTDVKNSPEETPKDIVQTNSKPAQTPKTVIQTSSKFAHYRSEDFEKELDSSSQPAKDILDVLSASDVEPEVRIVAIRHAGNMKIQDAIPLLITQTRSKNANERTAAVHALGNFPGNDAVYEAIVLTQNTQDAPLVPIAFRALHKLGDKRCIPLFIDIIGNDKADPGTVRQAIVTLYRMTGGPSDTNMGEIMRNRSEGAKKLKDWWEKNQANIVIKTPDDNRLNIKR